MSRGPGRWQRAILERLAEVGDFSPIIVTDLGVDLLGGPMTESEYRSILRAAKLLATRGRAHAWHVYDLDARRRQVRRTAVTTCPKCSHEPTREHLPMRRCSYCGAPTDRVLKYRPDKPCCGGCIEQGETQTVVAA